MPQRLKNRHEVSLPKPGSLSLCPQVSCYGREWACRRMGCGFCRMRDQVRLTVYSFAGQAISRFSVVGRRLVTACQGSMTALI